VSVEPASIDAYFAGRDESRALFDAVESAALELDETEVRATKSQVAFRRRRGFASVWIPAKYLHGPVAPLVLTIALRRHDPSNRWKQVIEAAPGRFTHHLELWSTDAVDDEVRAWLREAWESAG